MAPPPFRFLAVPYKANAARRHHITRPKRRVTNWAAYDEALRQRGSLTVWVSGEAVAQWKAAPRTTPGGQPHYSDLAITTALMLRAVFRLAPRQTEGLRASILHLLGLDLPAPDHSTIARRAHPPAGGQHRAEVVWTGRMADRETRHQEAALLARSAHRDGRRYGPDRRGHVDRARRR